jgi:glycerophosphoryl diester phosphodiesterase
VTTSTKPVLAGPRPFAIAHRGSKLIWPENTMMAFSHAHESGLRWIETDLHVSRDGHVVCIHDDTVDRTTNASGPVSDFTAAELGVLDAAFHFDVAGDRPYRDQGHGVPTLEDLATEFDDCRLVVDLKQDGLTPVLWELIRRLDIADRVIVGSFSDRRLSEFRQISDGAVATSAGPRAVARALAAAALTTPPLLADALQVPVSARGVPIVTARSVSKFHKAGYQVHVWTVNSSKQMHRLLDLGVDAIITDRPDALKAVMIERGVWTGV